MHDGDPQMSDVFQSSFQKRANVKPWVVIDPSVILAAIAEDTEKEVGKPCAVYLRKAGFQFHPYITKPMMGEILNEVISLSSEYVAKKAFDFIFTLLKDFKRIPHMNLNDSDLNILYEHFSHIPVDDRLHIAHICEANRSWVTKQPLFQTKLSFATIDKEIRESETIRRLQNRLGLRVINPLEWPLS